MIIFLSMMITYTLFTPANTLAVLRPAMPLHKISTCAR